MPRNKRARVQGDGMEGRTGITWRDPNYVLEMRLSKRVDANLKLHFGSYKTVEEAHVGRDYAAYVRNSTGKEDPATVGGFNPDVHPSIFKFKESPAVFESLECPGSRSRAHARCDEYRSLLEALTTETCKKLCKKFCEAAKDDIGAAIESFRSRDPQTFPTEPADGEIHRTPAPLSSEVRVSPTPGREVGASMGEGRTMSIGPLSLEVQIIVNGSPLQIVNLCGPPLFAEEISRMAEAGIDTMERFHRELADKLLEELPSCLIDPATIPALE